MESEHAESGEEVVGKGEDGLHVSAGRIVHERSGNHRADAGVEESVPEGTGFGAEDADILYQSSWKEPECLA